MRSLLYRLLSIVRVLRWSGVGIPFDFRRDKLLLLAGESHARLTTYVAGDENG